MARNNITTKIMTNQKLVFISPFNITMEIIKTGRPLAR